MKSMLMLTGLLLATAAGCQSESMSSQSLGAVSYAQAFTAARDVMAQYFSVESADPATGKIVARPQPLDPVHDRLLGASQARRTGMMRITQVGPDVLAEVTVRSQRQDPYAMTAQPGYTHSEAPNETPAQGTAATTAEQNQAWETTGRDYRLERSILNDLRERLAAAATQPATSAPSTPGASRP